MPELLKALIAKKAPVQNGFSPFSRVIFGRLIWIQQPIPIAPSSCHNFTKH